METPETLAFRLAKLCKLSYKNSKLNCNHIFIQQNNFCCVITEDDNFIYCAFRGTDEIKDMQTYFDYDNCQPICNAVNKLLKTTNKEIILCGHSIGGLIAQICSTKLVYFDSEKISRSMISKIVTFGSPKCKLLIIAPHDRWVNGNDVVAELPFNTLSNGQLYFLPGHKWKFWKNDHSITNYIENLKIAKTFV